MNATAPMVKLEMIERSQQCFTLGLLGLLPLIGLPLAVMALRQYFLIKRLRGGTWNPAERYARRGGVCGAMAFLLLAGEVVAVVAVYILSTMPD